MLAHEVDRFIVAQRAGDESLKTQALAAIAEALKGNSAKFATSRLCEERGVPYRWRTKQQQARMQAARAAGVCAKT